MKRVKRGIVRGDEESRRDLQEDWELRGGGSARISRVYVKRKDADELQ